MKRKNKKTFIGSIFLVLLLVIIIMFSFCRNESNKFVLTNTLSRISSNEIGKLRETDGKETKNIPLDDFIEWDNVSVNETLFLVNDEYKLNSSYVADTVYLEERCVYVNECIQEDFDSLSKHIYDEFGETLFISSAYRTEEDQIRIKKENGDIAQEPGCSEHQTGLAVDVFVSNYSGEGFIKCDVGRFVNEKSGDYGFIVRYPAFAERKIGIAYEPWHLRYVGYPHSKIINESFITLEEYIDFLECGEFYSYENHLITRQDTVELTIPCEFESAVLSFDNTGAVIITFTI